MSPADVLRGFADLAEVARDCPRGCTHEAGALDCALDEWAAAPGGGPPGGGSDVGGGAGKPHPAAGTGPDTVAGPDTAEVARRRARVDSFRRLLTPPGRRRDQRR